MKIAAQSAQMPPPGRPFRSQANRLPLFFGAAVVALTVLALRLEGRLWLCTCGQIWVWVNAPRSPHTSQHIFDPYSLTHVLHGFLFLGILKWLAGSWSARWRTFVVLGLEAGWEILENSPWIIQRYRTNTAALGYSGDTVINALGDIFSCLLGVAIAQRLGWRWTTALLVATELLLLWWIRDNLALNVIMLFIDSEGLRRWQGG